MNDEEVLMFKRGASVPFQRIALVGFMLLVAIGAFAQSSDQPFHPQTSTIFGNTGIWKVFNASNLDPKQASFSVWYDRYIRNPGVMRSGTVGVSGAVGILSWLEFGANIELNRRIVLDNQSQLSLGQQAIGWLGAGVPGSPATPLQLVPGTTMPQVRLPLARNGTFNGTAGYFNNFPFVGNTISSNGIGTVGLGVKLKVMSQDDGKPFGLAVRGYFDIPTHRSTNFLLFRPVQSGDNQFGTDVILTRYVGDLAELDLNAGYRAIQSPSDGRAIVLSDSVPLGFGLVIPRKTRFQVLGEVNADVFVNDHTPSSSFGARDPIDGTVGLRGWLTNGLALSAGYRHRLNAQGGSGHGFIADATYTIPAGAKAPPAPPSVSCSADPTEVMAGGPINLSAQAVSSTGKVLTYAWTTTGGVIEGSGPTVRLKTEGLAPGTYTQTVRVTEGPTSSADCTTRITIKTPPPPPQPPTITCSADHPRVQVGEIITINCDGKSPDNRPLKYECTSTGGRLTGDGPSFKLDTTGLAPGTYTIRCKVTDDRGLSAETSLDVMVVAPPPPPPPPPAPQASKLGDCDFARNSARVDNVCKAKLDDAALRLRNDAEAHLVIIGTAETRETRADRTATTRANNAKTYLVKERGIAESRIETRQGTNGTGAAARKTEIHFVPRGATFTTGQLFFEPTWQNADSESAPVAERTMASSRAHTKQSSRGAKHASVASIRKNRAVKTARVRHVDAGNTLMARARQ